MRIINIYSRTIRDVIKDIATAMDGIDTHDWNESSIKIPASWGRGTISGYGFSDGMRLLQYDCVFHDDVQLHFLRRSICPLVMNYCMAGKMEARFEHLEDFVTVEQYQSLILVNQENKGYVLQFKKEEEVKSRSIEINRKEFCKCFLMEYNPMEIHYKALFEEPDMDSFYQNPKYSVVLSHYFDEIDKSRFKGLIRALHAKGVVLQILSEQFNLYEDELKDDGVKGILRQYEVTCIHQAAQIIDGELEELASIPQLAHRVGINSNKLQDGFRILYKKTVNGYVQDARLKRAVYLLHHSDFTISEIVIKLGLSSKSYFSKIFRDSYGITPSDYRKNSHTIPVRSSGDLVFSQ